MKEYLDVMQPPSKSKIWANGDVLVDSHVAPDQEPTIGVVVSEAESEDEYQVLTKKPRRTQTELPAEADLVAPAVAMGDEAGELNPDPSSVTAQPDATGNEAGPVSDADWLRSRTNRVLDFAEDGDELEDTKNAQNTNQMEIHKGTQAVEAESGAPIATFEVAANRS